MSKQQTVAAGPHIEMAALEARGVGVTYPTRSGEPLVAVSETTISVNRGEFVSLIGPSGCGKSTLLHCLGGLISPSHGTIHAHGEEVRRPDPKRGAFVFQEYSLLPWKNVLANVGIGLRFAGQSKAARQQRARQALELVGLAQFANSYPDELSGGMQQRVAVARALAMDPETLLMDEPFGALDEQTRRALGLDMTKLLTAQNKTVVMVTHSLDEAIFWGDRVIAMTGRPGSVAREFTIPELRPRNLEYMLSHEFGDLRSELMRLLEQTAQAREADGALSAGAGPRQVSGGTRSAGNSDDQA